MKNSLIFNRQPNFMVEYRANKRTWALNSEFEICPVGFVNWMSFLSSHLMEEIQPHSRSPQHRYLKSFISVEQLKKKMIKVWIIKRSQLDSILILELRTSQNSTNLRRIFFLIHQVIVIGCQVIIILGDYMQGIKNQFQHPQIPHLNLEP